MSEPSQTLPPVTSPNRRASLIERRPYGPRVRRLRVVRTESLSPTMRRIVLTGPELEAGFPFVPLAAADHVKLALPDEESGELRLPGDGPGPGPGRSLRDLPGTAVLRDYTIRLFDHRSRELSLDFVLHEHGPAGRWALRAAPGDEIGVLGPRGSQVYPTSFERYVLVADETGLPAVERFLVELPAAIDVHVVLIVPGGAVGRPLGDGRPVGSTVFPAEASGNPTAELTDAVVDAVRDVGADAGTFCWGAGEASLMRAVRRTMRSDVGVPVAQIAVQGYWRVGVVGSFAS